MLMLLAPRFPVLALALFGASAACSDFSRGGPELSKARASKLEVGQRVPDVPEAEAVGGHGKPVERNSPAFASLVRAEHDAIVFKDEEKTGADRVMTSRLRRALAKLAARVEKEWPGTRLRVTEAWDEDREHAPKSLHYAGRAADLTTSDLDPDKLADLARLAVDSGFDWVYYENATHVHVSVRED